MEFNHGTTDVFDIELIFTDSVGFGKEYKIYEMKVPWVSAYTLTDFYAN